MSQIFEGPSTALPLSRLPAAPIPARSPDVTRQTRFSLSTIDANAALDNRILEESGVSRDAVRPKFALGRYVKLASSQVAAASVFYFGTKYYLDAHEIFPVEFKNFILNFVLIATLMSSGLVSAVCLSRPRFSDTRTVYQVIETGLEHVDFDPEASFSPVAKRQAILDPWRFSSKTL